MTNMSGYDIAKKIISGLITGALYYIVFIVLLPYVMVNVFGLYIEEMRPEVLIFYLGVFISIGIASSILPSFIGVIFESLSYLIGILILVSLVQGGVFQTTVNYQGTEYYVAVDLRFILLVIIGLGVISTMLSMFQRLIHTEL